MIEFGLAGAGVLDITQQARRLEALGYDYFGTGEHISFHTPTTTSFVGLATAAAVTTRLRLMSTVALLPLYPPPLLAKMAASLDYVSGGRFSLGVGVGGENPAEFEACGIPLAERGARADEALAVVRALWTGRDVDFDGRFTSFRGLTIDPPPIQSPHPPIWVTGRRGPARRRAGRLGDGWLPYFMSPELLRTSYDDVDDACRDAGRPEGSVRRGVFIFTLCHPDGDLARRLASAKLQGTYGMDLDRILDTYCLVGTPEHCRARLEEYLATGAETVFFASACPDELVVEHEARLADELIAAFRDRTPAGASA